MSFLSPRDRFRVDFQADFWKQEYSVDCLLSFLPQAPLLGPVYIIPLITRIFRSSVAWETSNPFLLGALFYIFPFPCLFVF